MSAEMVMSANRPARVAILESLLDGVGFQDVILFGFSDILTTPDGPAHLLFHAVSEVDPEDLESESPADLQVPVFSSRLPATIGRELMTSLNQRKPFLKVFGHLNAIVQPTPGQKLRELTLDLYEVRKGKLVELPYTTIPPESLKPFFKPGFEAVLNDARGRIDEAMNKTKRPAFSLLR